MAELEKIKRKQKSKTDEDGRLYKEVMAQKPSFASNAEALEATVQQLNALATKHGLSVDAFLKKAESSSKFNEDYLEALALSRRISHFKK